MGTLLLVSHPLPPHKWPPSGVRDTSGGTEGRTRHHSSGLHPKSLLVLYLHTVSKSWMMVMAWEPGYHSLPSELWHKRCSPHLGSSSIQLLLDSLDTLEEKKVNFTAAHLAVCMSSLRPFSFSKGTPSIANHVAAKVCMSQG